MTIEEIQQKYPYFNWLELLNSAFPDSIQVNSSERAMFQAPEYFEKLSKLIATQTDRTIINYILWRIIQTSIPFLHDEALNYKLQFQSESMGNQKLKPRWRECAELTNELYVFIF